MKFGFLAFASMGFFMCSAKIHPSILNLQATVLCGHGLFLKTTATLHLKLLPILTPLASIPRQRLQNLKPCKPVNPGLASNLLKGPILDNLS